MKNKKIYVDLLIADELKKFIDVENLDIEIINDDQNQMKIIKPMQELSNCDDNTLYYNGNIGCALACKWADKLSISLAEIGKLLNFLHIKIRKCQLGCF